MRLIVCVLMLLALQGCIAHRLNTLQFNGEAEPFPVTFRDLAADALTDDQREGAMVSRPRTILGADAFAPLRWYICLRYPNPAWLALAKSREKVDPDVRPRRPPPRIDPWIERAVIISGGRLAAGGLGGQMPEVCKGVSYEAL